MKAGAGGNIGADFVVKAPADGHTMMITSIGKATNWCAETNPSLCLGHRLTAF